MKQEARNYFHEHLKKAASEEKLTKLMTKSEVINLELSFSALEIDASFYYKDADVYDVSKKLDLNTFTDDEKWEILIFIVNLIYRRQNENRS